MEQSRLRVGGWVDHLPDASNTPTSGGGRAPALPSIDPVGDLTGELDLGIWGAEPDGQGETYRGRRRHRAGRTASPLRVAVVAVLVTAVLLGGGLLSQTLRSGHDPGPLTAPPPQPEHTRAALTDADARLGSAASSTATPGQPEGDHGSRSAASSGGGAAGSGEGDTTRPDPPAVVAAGHEAEHADLGGQAVAESFDGASGGQVVRLWGSGGYVEFTGLTVQQSGNHTLTIFYSGSARTVQVTVNDESTTLGLPATGDGDIAAATMSVDLVNGVNTIRLATSAGPPLYLDGITVD